MAEGEESICCSSNSMSSIEAMLAGILERNIGWSDVNSSVAPNSNKGVKRILSEKCALAPKM
jgi:hypothetical protein